MFREIFKTWLFHTHAHGSVECSNKSTAILLRQKLAKFTKRIHMFLKTKVVVSISGGGSQSNLPIEREQFGSACNLTYPTLSSLIRKLWLQNFTRLKLVFYCICVQTFSFVELSCDFRDFFEIFFGVPCRTKMNFRFLLRISDSSNHH